MLAHKIETVQSFKAFTEGRGLPEWPAEIFLELSNVCDLKCAMCPTFSALNPYRLTALKATERGFLDSKGLARPLEQVLRHALNVHCFGYGEPTIHPDFRETLDYLAQFQVMIDFFTNGMHLDADLAEFLVRSRVYKITVSFSGATKEDYENVYLGGVFETVLGGLRHLSEAKQRAGRAFPIVVINSLAFQRWGSVFTFTTWSPPPRRRRQASPIASSPFRSSRPRRSP
jgi:MoaA/NifB/PqqE/SkfB family radical SAM enzyme